ncbi:MAG TPA: peptide-methionine (S)-S-oxide reductase MsrA [Thermoanaerobaculia bacterium]|nr:peptide-methionine (S)-S-oxide reductase MsrA [Thermoanaerobaculia bacterium]
MTRQLLFSTLLTIALLSGDRTVEAATAKPATPALAKATFAGGCFWCMEPPFDKLKGVISTTSGYTAGSVANPSYEQVSAGGTGHTEAVQIVYDPRRISYGQLLDVFWKNIDPLTANAQFCDSGSQYRSGIYFHDEGQRQLAEQTKRNIDQSKRFDRPVVTEVQKATQFYPAEEYHQNYYIKNPVRYKYYRYGCGRDKRLQELWGRK